MSKKQDKKVALAIAGMFFLLGIISLVVAILVNEDDLRNKFLGLWCVFWLLGHLTSLD